MTDSENLDSDVEVALKFMQALEGHGIQRDSIETVSDDPDALHSVAHVLRSVTPDAEKRAELRWRRQKLADDIDSLEVHPNIVSKLLGADYDKLFKVAMATEDELRKGDFLTNEEINLVNSAMNDLGFDGLRSTDTAMITRLLELWGAWAHIPSAVRKHYEL